MKICLVNADLLTRCAYVNALLEVEGVDSVADFETIAECEMYLNRIGADAVLIDVALTSSELERVKDIRLRYSDVKFIILADQQEVLPVIALGAVYVLKNYRLEQFVQIVASALEGNLFFSREVSDFIISIFKEKVEKTTLRQDFNLTQREKEVLFRVSKGESNAEIGAKLYLSAFTVKNYVSRIIEKLGVKDRTQATAKAIQCGLV